MKFDRQKIENWFKNPYNLALLGILVLAFAIRLYFFFVTKNQAVWWDEGEYMLRVNHLVFGSPQSGFFIGRELFTPYFWALVFLIFKSELAIRFVQVIISMFTVFSTYYLGKEVYDKKTGLLAALMISTFWLHLFFTARLLTYLYAPLFYTLVLALFWKGRYSDSPHKEKYLFLSFTTITIGLGIYYSVAFAAVALLIFLFLTEQFKFLVDKKLWKVFLLSLPFLLLSFIPSYLVQGHIIPRLGQIETISANEFGAGLAGLFTYTRMMPTLLLSVYLVILVASLFMLLRLGLYFDFIIKQKEGSATFNKDLYIFLGAFIPLGIYTWLSMVAGGAAGASYDAWILPVFPALFCFMSNFMFFTGDYLSGFVKSKKIVYALIIALVLFGSYSQLGFARANINGKVDSFYNLKPAGAWLLENSQPEDIVLSSAVPELTYYSQREIMSFDTNQSKAVKNMEELSEAVNRIRPAYFAWTLWERSPDWLNAEIHANPTNPQNILNLTLVQVFYMDQNGQKVPDVLIYKINY